MIASWLLVMSTAALPGDLPPAKPWIRIDLDGRPQAVEVVGIDAANLKKLAEVGWDFERWRELFPVAAIAGKGPAARAMPLPGSYRVAGDVLRFEAKFPIDPDLTHEARFRPSRLPVPPAGAAEISAPFAAPRLGGEAESSVVRVAPSGDRVPENLLKIYIHFSGPMSRGEVYQRVSLIDAAGKAVDMPFLELGEELWDPSGTRITLLLDPGRVKRGLKPREEEGPILEAGRRYTLEVDPRWPDAGGRPLKGTFRATFDVGPPVEARLDVRSWTIVAPQAGTRDPLAITFPRPLDRAMLDRALGVADRDGHPVVGKVSIDRDETRWQFAPLTPWEPGVCKIRVNPLLEDLAGNSLLRAFEVDLLHPVGEAAPEAVIVPFTVASPRGK